jgi:hypothetical protein
MSLSPEHQAQLKAESYDAACSLVEDLAHMREVVDKKEPDVPEVRRMSGILRRILVERALSIVATPRLGRIELSAPDLSVVYNFNKKHPIAFFSGANIKVFGQELSSIAVHNYGPRNNLASAGHDPYKVVMLRFDNFLTQKVLCLKGQWISRGDIIKYVANIGHGIHSGKIKPSDPPSFELIQATRSSVKIEIKNGSVAGTFHMAHFASGAPNYSLDRTSLDCTLLEIMSSARYLIISDAVKRLEEMIRHEMSGS